MTDWTNRRPAPSESVAVGYVHPVDGVGADFHVSMIKLLMADAGSHQRVKLHLHLASGANITTARNQVVRTFLNFRPKIDWLWSIDADMSFDPDCIERLLAAAHPKTAPIMGGLCFALDRGEGSPQEIVPTLYGFAPSTEDDDTPSMIRYQNYERESVVLAGATGAACLLVHRSVLEDLETRWAENAPWNWFQEAVFAGEPIGEDVTFCLRTLQAGYPLYVDTRVKTGHTKPFVINEALFDKQFAAPVAEEVPTYVVIPVKNRRDLTKSILTQLKSQGGYTEILVYDNGSTDGTVAYLERQEVASSFDAKGAGIYNMWNEGVKEAQRQAGGKPCNIAILNNDLTLGPDFLRRMAYGLRSGPTSLLGVCGNYDRRTGPTPLLPTTGTFKDGGFAGFAFMVKGEAMGTAVPYFDEAYTWYFGDDDFVHEVERAGGTLAMVLSADFVHIGGGSQTSSAGTKERLGTKALRDSVEGDTEYYVSKWQRVDA